MAEFEPIVDVTSVRVVSRYIVEVGFANGEVKVVDLESHLWGEAFDPLLQDYELFRAVAVDEEAGTITWPNGADISPRALYEQGRPAIPRPAAV